MWWQKASRWAHTQQQQQQQQQQQRRPTMAVGSSSSDGSGGRQHCQQWARITSTCSDGQKQHKHLQRRPEAASSSSSSLAAAPITFQGGGVLEVLLSDEGLGNQTTWQPIESLGWNSLAGEGYWVGVGTAGASCVLCRTCWSIVNPYTLLLEHPQAVAVIGCH